MDFRKKWNLVHIASIELDLPLKISGGNDARCSQLQKVRHPVDVYLHNLAKKTVVPSCSCATFLCFYWLRQIVVWIRIRGPESRLVKSMTHSIPETQPGWPIGNRKEVHDVNQLVVHLHLNKSYETLWAKWRLQDFQLLCVVFRITVYRQDQVFFSKGIFWEYSPNWRSTSEENFETYDVVPFGWCRKEQWLVANKAVQAKIFGSIKSAKLNWNQEPFSL